MYKPKTWQKISFGFALLSYLAALACAAAMLFIGHRNGSNDPAAAAFAASIVFFIGAGVVLQVFARTNLPNLRIER
ncbi:MAG TPA: hemerythrin family protein [Gammaproteobacteria bacterium]|nr:hemerythrin family protein [Gammaproteobacteria bacterium]